MKSLFATALILIATPALAAEPTTTSAPASAELPMTARFAAAVTDYRNCVLEAVDAGTTGDHRAMATAAMSSCAMMRGRVAAQLTSDILAQQPTLTSVAAATTAAGGLNEIDPMIEEAAIERAHAKYAQSMA